MLDDQSVIGASQSHPEPVEGDFGGLLSRNREKSSFDELRMISRYARSSNL